MSQHRFRLEAVITLGAICLALAAAPSLAQTAHVTSPSVPGFGKVEFANETITVLRVQMAPHEKTPMHDIVSARLVIWLTDAHMRDTGPDGNVSEYTRSAGAVEWVTPRRHMGENLSDHEIGFLAVIPARASLPPPAHGAPPH